MNEIINTLIVLSGLLGFCLGILITMFYVWSLRESTKTKKRRLSLLCEDCREKAKIANL